MRTYISVDMEGITGAAVGKHVQPGEKEYDRFRRLMTQEVNAAIEGALAGGATDVVVSDGHGPMTNVMVEELHPGARLISGSNKILGQLEGIDRGFDAALFVGLPPARRRRGRHHEPHVPRPLRVRRAPEW